MVKFNESLRLHVTKEGNVIYLPYPMSASKAVTEKAVPDKEFISQLMRLYTMLDIAAAAWRLTDLAISIDDNNDVMFGHKAFKAC